MRFVKFFCLLSIIFIASGFRAGYAATGDHWVGTWAAAPVRSPNPLGDAGSSDQTLREVVHVSIGGSTVRVVLTNEYGTDPLTIGAAQVALRLVGSQVQVATAKVLTFDGKPAVVIPPGRAVTSDPVEIQVPALSDLDVSLFVPKQAMRWVTLHPEGKQTNYLGAGNQVGEKKINKGARGFRPWRFLKAVEVMAPADAGAIVTLGDSITDGAQSTPDANARWPDELARRLQANTKTAGLSVLNAGISGNRLLKDTDDPPALERFDRDVLGQSGVRYLIVLEGINDIGRTAAPLQPGDTLTTAAALVAGLQQIIDRAHAHGIKVFGGTLVPFGDSSYYSPASEAMREAENQFIRSGAFDGVIEFNKALQSPLNVMKMDEGFDSGDHLHPSDLGYRTMGDAIDLKLFEQ